MGPAAWVLEEPPGRGQAPVGAAFGLGHPSSPPASCCGHLLASAGLCPAWSLWAGHAPTSPLPGTGHAPTTPSLWSGHAMTWERRRIRQLQPGESETAALRDQVPGAGGGVGGLGAQDQAQAKWAVGLGEETQAATGFGLKSLSQVVA